MTAQAGADTKVVKIENWFSAVRANQLDKKQDQAIGVAAKDVGGPVTSHVVATKDTLLSSWGLAKPKQIVADRATDLSEEEYKGSDVQIVVSDKDGKTVGSIESTCENSTAAVGVVGKDIAPAPVPSSEKPEIFQRPSYSKSPAPYSPDVSSETVFSAPEEIAPTFEAVSLSSMLKAIRPKQSVSASTPETTPISIPSNDVSGSASTFAETLETSSHGTDIFSVLRERVPQEFHRAAANDEGGFKGATARGMGMGLGSVIYDTQGTGNRSSHAGMKFEEASQALRVLASRQTETHDANYTVAEYDLAA